MATVIVNSAQVSVASTPPPPVWQHRFPLKAMICSKGNAFLHFKRRVFFWYAGFTRDWHKAFKGLSFPTSSIPPVARKGPFHCFCSVQALWLHSPFASTHSAARNPSMKLGPPGESWKLALKEACWAELMWAVTKTPGCLYIAGN